MIDELEKYEDFLETFLIHKYRFAFFDDEDIFNGPKIYLRHDIDFNCKYALQMAKVEKNMGIFSTYFFLLTSDSYNLLSVSNIECVKKIINMGHKVSIHFDMSVYENIDESLKIEIQLFEKIFNTKVEHVSIHKPPSEILGSPRKINGIEHTYNERFFSNIHYYSDSNGKWYYGSPLNSDVFIKREDMQILVHPIWWIKKANTIDETFDMYLQDIHRESSENIKEILRKNRRD